MAGGRADNGAGDAAGASSCSVWARARPRRRAGRGDRPHRGASARAASAGSCSRRTSTTSRMAQRSPALADAYRRCFLSLADGMPMVLASRLLGLPLQPQGLGQRRVRAAARSLRGGGLPVFFFGSTAEPCERAIAMLKERYPDDRDHRLRRLVLRSRRRPGRGRRGARTEPAPAVPASSSARCLRRSRSCCRSSCGSTRRRSAWPRAARSASSSATSSGRRRGCRRLSFEWLWRLVQEPAAAVAPLSRRGRRRAAGLRRHGARAAARAVHWPTDLTSAITSLRSTHAGLRRRPEPGDASPASDDDATPSPADRAARRRSVSVPAPASR